MPATDALSKLPNSISRRYQLRSTKTGLLGLSPETRKTIYHYLFEDAEIDSANDKCDEDPILSVCKTIRNEAKVMFYKTAWIGIFEESGPTFTSNIYNYSENVQLSCYNPRMPDFGQLDHMRTLRHIHLHAQLCDNMGMQPHAEEEQLLEAIKIDLDYEISLMQDFARKYPKAKVDIESSFYPMRRHATMIDYVIDSKLESVQVTGKWKKIRKEFDWTHDRGCGVCSTRSVMWFLVRVRLAALMRRKRNVQG